MTIIVYTCDTCKRDIELLQNKSGLDSVGRCIITDNCKGHLHRTATKPGHTVPAMPAVVEGLRDWVQRRVLHNHTQTLLSNEWLVTHNLGTEPSTQVFIDTNNGRIEIEPELVEVINSNQVKIHLNERYTGIAQLLARSSSIGQGITSVTLEDEVVEQYQLSTSLYLTLGVKSDIYNELDIHFISPSDNSETIISLPISTVLNNTPWEQTEKVLIKGATKLVKGVTISPQLLRTNKIVEGSFVYFTVDGNPIVDDEIIFLLTKEPFTSAADRNILQYASSINVTTSNAVDSFNWDGEEFFGKSPTLRTSFPPIQTVGVIPLSPPTERSVLRTVDFDYQSITFDWLPVAEATGYRLEDSGNGIIIELDGPILTTTVTDLLPNKTYSFTVAGINEIAFGPNSNTEVNTTLQIQPQDASVLTLANNSAFSATLTWTRVFNADGYRIVEFDNTLIQDVGNVNFSTISGLTPVTIYSAKIIPYNTEGDGPESDVVEWTSLNIPPTAVPVLSLISTQPFSATIDWTPIPNVTGYRLEDTESNIIDTYFDTTHIELVENLNQDTTYNWVIIPFNEIGDGTPSNTLSFTTDQSAPVGTPILTLTSIGAGEASFTWTSVDYATGYEMYEAGSPDTLLETFGNITSGTITGLTRSSDYTFFIRPINIIGNGEISNTITFSTSSISLITEVETSIPDDNNQFGFMGPAFAPQNEFMVANSPYGDNKGIVELFVNWNNDFIQVASEELVGGLRREYAGSGFPSVSDRDADGNWFVTIPNQYRSDSTGRVEVLRIRQSNDEEVELINQGWDINRVESLEHQNARDGDEFGSVFAKITPDSRWIVAGAPGDGIRGRGFIFERNFNDENDWEPIVNNGIMFTSNFGSRLGNAGFDISDDGRWIIGGYGDVPFATLFERTGNGNDTEVTLVAEFNAEGSISGDRFGSKKSAISGDGQWIVVTADFRDNRKGAVHLFKNNNGVVTEVDTFIGTVDNGRLGEYGCSNISSSGQFMVGSVRSNDNQGLAYFFTIDTDNEKLTLNTVTTPDNTPPGSFFGAGSAISNSGDLIGITQLDTNIIGNGEGSVFVYDNS